LPDHRPRGARSRETFEQPLLLIGAEYRARGIACVRAFCGRASADLVGSILPRVEDVQVDEAPEPQSAVQPQVRSRREKRRAYRHRFVIGLIRRGPAQQEDLRRRAVLVAITGVVVVHFVIVPGHDERRRQVRRVQVIRASARS
jgi:hypothetical protein